MQGAQRPGEMTVFILFCGFYAMTFVVEAAYCAISAMIKCVFANRL